MIIRWFKQINTLSDGARILIYTGLSLFAIISLVLVTVFRSELWRALLLLFYTALVIGALGAIGYGLLRIVQNNRMKRAMAEKFAHDEQFQLSQQRAQLLRAIAAGEAKPLSDSSGVFLRNSAAL